MCRWTNCYLYGLYINPIIPVFLPKEVFLKIFQEEGNFNVEAISNSTSSFFKLIKKNCFLKS